MVDRQEGRWVFAAIRPAGRPEGLWALPKGQIDAGERAEATALREVAEETGATGVSLGKLGDVRYWFNWEGERIFKVVSFFLVRYEGGELGNVPDAFRHEIAEVRWLPLEDAERLLAYSGEREMARKAAARLAGENL
ncbi:MAG: NUDIX domain-containing protein [Actinobacteria bacterium]|nr:NUDIX domain-containing protein [Actinomycetota bacterium]MBV8481128.1 NUDIX domain-containing protein [Actinomycetota bacterium]MBV8562791.1 NUDIX domain-containing protein [Actinomycetota bacterium]